MEFNKCFLIYCSYINPYVCSRHSPHFPPIHIRLEFLSLGLLPNSRTPNMKVIFSGLESSGKSLRLAEIVSDIALRNHKWKKETNIQRPIVSNLHFSKKFFDYCTTELEIPIIYWENLDELIRYDNADIIIDEVGTYFDARLWTDLSLDVRRWLTQGAKSGIEIYGTAQDFAQVDLAFRRLVNHLFHITKLVGSRRPSATTPPIKRIWGLCSIRELNPREYKEDKKSFDSTQIIPSFFWIERIYCEMFDTTQKIARSRPTPYRHVERTCELPTCAFHKTAHI